MESVKENIILIFEGCLHLNSTRLSVHNLNNLNSQVYLCVSISRFKNTFLFQTLPFVTGSDIQLTFSDIRFLSPFLSYYFCYTGAISTLYTDIVYEIHTAGFRYVFCPRTYSAFEIWFILCHNSYPYTKQTESQSKSKHRVSNTKRGHTRETLSYTTVCLHALPMY